MPRAARTLSAMRRRPAWAGMFCAGVLLAGCCGPLTSLRYRPTGPAGEAVQQGAACSDVAAAADRACAVPPTGYCGADRCPSLLFCSWPHLCRLLGPIAIWPRPPAPTEEGLQPPHSRFHPVPTAPVFAQRDDYLAPLPSSAVPMTSHP